MLIFVPSLFRHSLSRHSQPESYSLLRDTLLPAALLLPLALAGCSKPAIPNVAEQNALAAEHQQETNLARQQMELIPPPSKTRYMAVKSLNLWENPYLTVQGAMATLHVVVADGNTSGLGVGGMLRPIGARRRDLNVRVIDLPTALNAIPENSWPYGRVVAVEEAHEVPVSARPEVRRNLESVIKTLNDLGVVVYEWSDNGRS
ncbi:hypothetical protein HDF13_003984 [Edaphobacter lichenicola]|uniref:Uncharacterized protein n=1 Tax=Tunturiibacter gelidiferens TaxID=3069689 RepID=A0ACC5P4K6_9BACT|nr:hypothetical protein [Edaphobacter lichenicola]